MAMTLITTNTSSGAATSDFTSSIDSTYKLYIFKFININPATNQVYFQFQVNATDGADYNDSAITSTFFVSSQSEAASTALSYDGSYDQAQGTAFQVIAKEVGSDSDQHCAGELHLFNPSSTTYVKHFYSTTQGYLFHDYTQKQFSAGYINDTTAIDDIRFKMSSGNFDGKIKMWGVK